MFSLFYGPGEEGIPQITECVAAMGSVFLEFLKECGAEIARSRKERAGTWRSIRGGCRLVLLLLLEVSRLGGWAACDCCVTHNDDGLDVLSLSWYHVVFLVLFHEDSGGSTGAGGAPKPPPINDPTYVKALISLLTQAKWMLKDAFKDNVELGKGLLVSGMWYYIPHACVPLCHRVVLKLPNRMIIGSSFLRLSHHLCMSSLLLLCCCSAAWSKS